MAILNLLYKHSFPITDKISVMIPTVGEILGQEESYYETVLELTAMPVDLMVMLDDMGLNFEKMNGFDLFLLLFSTLKMRDTHLIFGDLDLSKFKYAMDDATEKLLLVDTENDIKIDWAIYSQIAATLRKIHHLEKNNKTPGNEEARKYMLQRAREKATRSKGRSTDSQLEPLIISLVNTSEFKYDFDSVLDLTIYQFNECVHQIIHKIDYDNLMKGVYSGTVDTKKLSQDDLHWLKLK